MTGVLWGWIRKRVNDYQSWKFNLVIQVFGKKERAVGTAWNTQSSRDCAKHPGELPSENLETFWERARKLSALSEAAQTTSHLCSTCLYFLGLNPKPYRTLWTLILPSIMAMSTSRSLLPKCLPRALANNDYYRYWYVTGYVKRFGGTWTPYANRASCSFGHQGRARQTIHRCQRVCGSDTSLGEGASANTLLPVKAKRRDSMETMPLNRISSPPEQ